MPATPYIPMCGRSQIQHFLKATARGKSVQEPLHIPFCHSPISHCIEQHLWPWTLSAADGIENTGQTLTKNLD